MKQKVASESSIRVFGYLAETIFLIEWNSSLNFHISLCYLREKSCLQS